MFDTHTHCLHSHDSKEDPRDMILAAIDKGLDYIAFTDHYDGELTLLDEFSYIPQIDLDRHFKEISQLKDEFKGKIQVGVGIECGYMKEADDVYLNTLAKYDIDVTINSVHMVEYEDCYLPSFFQKRTKAEAYGAYLKAIRESVDSPYEFDSIGHIGYVVRKSIYDDKSLRYDEFSDIIDDILQSIIARYKELGGELLTFGSDAHLKSRIGEKYKLIADVLKGLGYKYLFKYLSHKPISVKL